MVRRVPQEDSTTGFRQVHTPLAIYEDATTKTPLIFDATLEYPVSRSAEITRHPVEDGVAVADHIVRGPRSLNFRGIFVNEETNADAARRRGNAGRHDPGNTRSTIATMVSNGPQVQHDRAQKNLERLIGLYERNTTPIFQVFTSLETLERVLMTDMTHREVGEGAIEVAGTMTEIRVASTTRRRAIPKSSVENASKTSVDIGTKATKPVDTATARKSIAAGAFDTVKGLLGL